MPNAVGSWLKRSWDVLLITTPPLASLAASAGGVVSNLLLGVRRSTLPKKCFVRRGATSSGYTFRFRGLESAPALTIVLTKAPYRDACTRIAARAGYPRGDRAARDEVLQQPAKRPYAAIFALAVQPLKRGCSVVRASALERPRHVKDELQAHDFTLRAEGGAERALDAGRRLGLCSVGVVAAALDASAAGVAASLQAPSAHHLVTPLKHSLSRHRDHLFGFGLCSRLGLGAA
mmetsp:Transcript_33538/g.105956  ORF Transcript_33538/g.105956 Transcript_33538/m.105956 type:complete len:233 (+) Transcript_33538:461-1159(+)